MISHFKLLSMDGMNHIIIIPPGWTRLHAFIIVVGFYDGGYEAIGI